MMSSSRILTTTNLAGGDQASVYMIRLRRNISAQEAAEGLYARVGQQGLTQHWLPMVVSTTLDAEQAALFERELLKRFPDIRNTLGRTQKMGSFNLFFTHAANDPLICEAHDGVSA